MPLYNPAGSGSAIISKDEGSTLTAATTSVDYVGAGVVATNSGGAVTVTVSGGGGGLTRGQVIAIADRQTMA